MDNSIYTNILNNKASIDNGLSSLQKKDSDTSKLILSANNNNLTALSNIELSISDNSLTIENSNLDSFIKLNIGNENILEINQNSVISSKIIKGNSSYFENIEINNKTILNNDIIISGNSSLNGIVKLNNLQSLSLDSSATINDQTININSKHINI